MVWAEKYVGWKVQALPLHKTMWREPGPGRGTPNGIEGLTRGGHQQRYTYKGFLGGVTRDELLALVEKGDGGNRGRHKG